MSKQQNETLKAEANVNLRPHSTYRVNLPAHTHRAQHRLTAERPLTSCVVELFITSYPSGSFLYYYFNTSVLYIYIYLRIFRHILTTNVVA